MGGVEGNRVWVHVWVRWNVGNTRWCWRDVGEVERKVGSERGGGEEGEVFAGWREEVSEDACGANEERWCSLVLREGVQDRIDHQSRGRGLTRLQRSRKASARSTISSTRSFG